MFFYCRTWSNISLLVAVVVVVVYFFCPHVFLGNGSCLKSNFGESQKFWFDMFAYYLKANDVCKWRQKNGYLLVAKWGESVCDDKIVNIFKKHKECTCSKVYFKKGHELIANKLVNIV